MDLLVRRVAQRPDVGRRLRGDGREERPLQLGVVQLGDDTGGLAEQDALALLKVVLDVVRGRAVPVDVRGGLKLSKRGFESIASHYMHNLLVGTKNHRSIQFGTA